LLELEGSQRGAEAESSECWNRELDDLAPRLRKTAAEDPFVVGGLDGNDVHPQLPTRRPHFAAVEVLEGEARARRQGTLQQKVRDVFLEAGYLHRRAAGREGEIRPCLEFALSLRPEIIRADSSNGRNTESRQAGDVLDRAQRCEFL